MRRRHGRHRHRVDRRTGRTRAPCTYAVACGRRRGRGQSRARCDERRCPGGDCPPPLDQSRIGSLGDVSARLLTAPTGPTTSRRFLWNFGVAASTSSATEPGSQLSTASNQTVSKGVNRHRTGIGRVRSHMRRVASEPRRDLSTHVGSRRLGPNHFQTAFTRVGSRRLGPNRVQTADPRRITSIASGPRGDEMTVDHTGATRNVR